MEVFFAAAGVASLAYFAVIFIYNGMRALLWLWPCFAVLNFFLLLLVRILKRKRRRKQKARLRPYVFCFTSYALGVLCMLGLLVMIGVHARGTEARELDYLIVLGTDLDHNRISASLRRRLDRAVEYAAENRNTVFVLSGGRGDRGTSTEATVMYYYMIEHGVPEERLLMEFYSDSTLEKIGYSIRTIGEDLEEKRKLSRELQRLPEEVAEELVVCAEDRPLKIGILTSEINVYRAEAMAKRFGLREVSAIAVPTDELLLPHLAVREALAVFKDRLMGNC